MSRETLRNALRVLCGYVVTSKQSQNTRAVHSLTPRKASKIKLSWVIMCVIDWELKRWGKLWYVVRSYPSKINGGPQNNWKIGPVILHFYIFNCIFKSFFFPLRKLAWCKRELHSFGKLLLFFRDQSYGTVQSFTTSHPDALVNNHLSNWTCYYCIYCKYTL